MQHDIVCIRWVVLGVWRIICKFSEAWQYEKVVKNISCGVRILGFTLRSLHSISVILQNLPTYKWDKNRTCCIKLL